MGKGGSKINKNKPDKDDATFCIICYENDIKSQRLVCGHAFCLDCILSINDYEDCPRCPLCRHCIQIYDPLEDAKENSLSWFEISRMTVGFLVVLERFCKLTLITFYIHRLISQ